MLPTSLDNIGIQRLWKIPMNNSMPVFSSRLDRIDWRITRWLATNAITVLRVSLGFIFLWFGALKLFPGMSPAQDLAAHTISVLTFGLVPASVSLPFLAIWECVIGLGFLIGKFTRLTLALLVLQMAGTITPLLVFSAETFTWFPIAPTLEGQYIIKNAVLVSAGLVVGATVRGGKLVTH